mgnify:CR=1 FL=1
MGVGIGVGAGVGVGVGVGIGVAVGVGVRVGVGVGVGVVRGVGVSAGVGVGVVMGMRVGVGVGLDLREEMQPLGKRSNTTRSASASFNYPFLPILPARMARSSMPVSPSSFRSLLGSKSPSPCLKP